MTKVVVLGGGTGGTLTANLLARKIEDVTLVTSGDMHVFQPANLDIAFKGASPEKFVRRESALLSRRVRFIVEPAITINMDDRVLVTESGRRIGYDYLVIATGSETAPHQVEGLIQYSHNFHSGQQDSARTWEALKKFSGGKIVLLIAGVPHKCPPAPTEAMFLMDDFFRKRGIRERVELYLATPYPRAYPAAAIAEIVEPLFQERGINLVPYFSVDRVEKGAVYSMEGEKVEYDLLISIPPHTGAEVAKRSGIGDDEGWIPADKHTMRVENYDDVYAVGDCTNIPISKSGVVAHLQAGIVAKNIISDIEGGGVAVRFSGRINCPLEVGGGKAIFVSGTYSRPPKSMRPSRLRYLMKRGFSHMYWRMLSGFWEPFFNLYFRDSELDGGGP